MMLIKIAAGLLALLYFVVGTVASIGPEAWKSALGIAVLSFIGFGAVVTIAADDTTAPKTETECEERLVATWELDLGNRIL